MSRLGSQSGIAPDACRATTAPAAAQVRMKRWAGVTEVLCYGTAVVVEVRT